MPRIDKGILGKPLTLHVTLTYYECTVCGKLLQWNLGFNKDLNQPTYTSIRCNLEYELIIDTVKVRILEPSEQLRGKKIPLRQEIMKVNKEPEKEQSSKKKSEIPT